MSQTDTGITAPDFTLPAIGGAAVTLSAHRGRKIIVFFYSKDNTSG